MPYVSCPACELRFHAVATHSTVARCPRCDVALADGARDARVASLRPSAAAGLPDTLERHALVLLVFFVRRAVEAASGIALWAETIAQSQLAARRLRTEGETIAWLDAMAYRQLARFRATGRPDGRALRRLSLAVPDLDADELDVVERLAGLPELRRRAARGLPALTERDREIVRLRIAEGEPVCVVAARMDVSEDAVRSQVSRSLRDAAQAPGPPPPDADAIDELPTLQAWLAAEPAAGTGRRAVRA